MECSPIFIVMRSNILILFSKHFIFSRLTKFLRKKDMRDNGRGQLFFCYRSESTGESNNEARDSYVLTTFYMKNICIESSSIIDGCITGGYFFLLNGRHCLKGFELFLYVINSTL